MAEVNANSLPAKTDLGTNDSAIVVDQTTNAGALVDLDVLADKVLDRITSKTFANQVGGSSAATLLAQLSTLNSNMPNVSVTSVNAWTNSKVAGSGFILKYGNIAALVCDTRVTEEIAVNEVILTGLPHAYRNITSGIFHSSQNTCYLKVSTSGELTAYTTKIPAGYYSSVLIYVCS